MTGFAARDWATFLTAFGVLYHAGVAVKPVGGNTAELPDDIDPVLLATIAAMPGVAVTSDLPPAPKRTRRSKES